jgi:D-alanine-D-alanine ligase
MYNVAVIAGGDSGEYEVSMRSGAMVMKCIDNTKFNPYLVEISSKGWLVLVDNQKYRIDKNDFSFQKDGQKIRFDVIYNIIHGTPGEDGKIQGYFDIIGLPYTSPGLSCCAITMNKAVSKAVVGAMGLRVAKSVVLQKGKEFSADEVIHKTGLPVFVKPNSGGSSVATHKVYELKDFKAAVDDAFQHDNEVICEEFVQGMEITGGIFFDGSALVCLPITEIVPHHDFFDYKAKYLGESDEITPARIDESLKNKVNELTKKIYRILNCEGLVRIDFIIKESEPYFMEVNTIPGFSEQSIVPQQIRAAGMKEKDVITMLIMQAINGKKS